MRDLFRLGALHLNDLLVCLGLGLARVAWFDLFKRRGSTRITRQE
jgi:hypothetical protein